MNTDIRYSQQDAAETGHGWYAVRRDRDHKLPDVSHLFRTCEEAEAWRTSPAVRQEYERGLRNGWIGAMAFYGLLSLVLVLAFHVLGVRP